jgi:phosphopantothenoylcysteine synthetase/decarboxylase
MSLANRHILLGVTGGIAAYKAAELARLFIKAGAEVQVVMTASAMEFIGAMTFQAITGKETRSDLFDTTHEAAMGHIELSPPLRPTSLRSCHRGAPGIFSARSVSQRRHQWPSRPR